jgi:hypothetical protein
MELIFLSQGNKFKTFFLSTIDEGMDFSKKKYIIEIKYEDIKRRKYIETIIFDFSYLSDITIAHTDPLYKISKNIDEVSNSLKVISKNCNVLFEKIKSDK